MTPELRTKLEQAVERLIGVLDTIDAPEQDLEPQGDDEPDADGEPSLGAPETGPVNDPARYHSGSQLRWAKGNCEDPEDEHDGREPSEDAEPSLGWNIDGRNGFSVCDGEPEYGVPETGAGSQLNLRHHAYAPEDAEPSLAAPETGTGSQLGWAKGNRHDLEEQCEGEGDDGGYDNGIADSDGLLEQTGGSRGFGSHVE